MENQNPQSAAVQQQPEATTSLVSASETVEYLMSPLGQQLKRFELHLRMAQMYASSQIVPKQFQNKVGDCAIAIQMAERVGADTLTVMQNLDIVCGNPSWASQFKIALFNLSNRYSRLEYEWCGEYGKDTWGARAFCYAKDDVSKEHKMYGPWITIGMAKSEGWYDKAGSKWKTIPELMLRYRAASWMINTIAPDVTLGLPTKEEAEEISFEDVTEKPINPVVSFEEPEKEEPQEKKEPAPKKENVPSTDGKKVTKETLFD